MTEKDEEAGEPGMEWDREAAIELSFMEAREQAEAEAEKRELNWCREIIKKFHQERSNKNDQ